MKKDYVWGLLILGFSFGQIGAVAIPHVTKPTNKYSSNLAANSALLSRGALTAFPVKVEHQSDLDKEVNDLDKEIKNVYKEIEYLDKESYDLGEKISEKKNSLIEAKDSDKKISISELSSLDQELNILREKIYNLVIKRNSLEIKFYTKLKEKAIQDKKKIDDIVADYSNRSLSPEERTAIAKKEKLDDVWRKFMKTPEDFYDILGFNGQKSKAFGEWRKTRNEYDEYQGLYKSYHKNRAKLAADTMKKLDDFAEKNKHMDTLLPYYINQQKTRLKIDVDDHKEEASKVPFRLEAK